MTDRLAVDTNAVVDYLRENRPASVALMREDDVFASLSKREREILSLISEGLGNAQIGEQAMVFARDHGFRG